jgi:glycosyltransferase involved in cell wall biosynthesis
LLVKTLEGLIKIVIIGPNSTMSYRNGGVAKFVEYQTALKKSGNISTDFYFLDCNKVPTLKIPVFIRKYLGFIAALFQLLFTRSNIDCIHLHASLYDSGSLKNLLFAIICRLKKHPLFLQIHGGRLSKLSTTSKKLWSFIFKLTTKIGVFPGPQYEEIKKEGFEEKLLRIANFIPSKKNYCKDINYEQPHFFFLGRVVEEKGVFLLLDSFLQLKDEGIDAKLTIAGSGVELNEIKKQVYNSKFKNDINITGYVSGDELENVMKDCNIFVLPSWHDEGFPLSFLECSLRGMAPIITENNGIPFYFKEKEEYLPVDVEIDHDLYDQMKLVASDINLRRMIGNNVQKKVEDKFTIDSYLPVLVENYKKVKNAGYKNK